jgi:hypothetical protein
MKIIYWVCYCRIAVLGWFKYLFAGNVLFPLFNTIFCFFKGRGAETATLHPPPSKLKKMGKGQNVKNQNVQSAKVDQKFENEKFCPGC